MSEYSTAEKHRMVMTARKAKYTVKNAEMARDGRSMNQKRIGEAV